jgi:membrane-associated phospholipid phosphatase
VRGEIKRRFPSGFEVGAWYTVTNGHDITSPGTPSSPYHDKGVFIFIPLDTMLTYDTPAAAGIALAPWTRDVGQMVVSPGDLYRMVERPVVQMEERDGLSRFGDRDDDYDLPKLGADRRWPDFVLTDFANAGRSAAHMNALRVLAVGGAITLAAKPLDSTFDRFAKEHGSDQWNRAATALPLLAAGTSALFAFDSTRPYLADAGTAALEAGALTFLAAEGLQRVVHRSPPTGGGDQSFPSRETAVMWAAITPYAEAYDAPWLYGVAALTNVAATMGRKHWLSDTVGGAALGYGLGQLMWRSRRASVSVGPSAVTIRWDL